MATFPAKSLQPASTTTTGACTLQLSKVRALAVDMPDGESWRTISI